MTNIHVVALLFINICLLLLLLVDAGFGYVANVQACVLLVHYISLGLLAANAMLFLLFWMSMLVCF